jgi:hypothetical protein
MTTTTVPSTPPAPQSVARASPPVARIEQALAFGALTGDEARVLLFERAHPHDPRRGAKEHQVRDELAMTWTRYWQTLNALIDHPDALAADPATITRLRRLRDQRRGRRMPRPATPQEEVPR